MATVSNTGITSNTLNEYLVELRDAHKTIDPAWDVSPNSPDGQKLGTDAEVFARADEAIVAAYNSHDPASATGQALRNIGILSGNLTPIPAAPSTVDLEFTGTNGTVILAGSEFKNGTTGETWVTLDSPTITAGVASSSAFSKNTGPITASIGAITIIVNPQAGLTSVTNSSAASLGRFAETEEDFRVRRFISVSRPGANQTDSMLANILQVEDVKNAKIYENRTAAPDGDGLPAKSISVVVDGGETDDIALAIYQKLTPGPEMFGDTGAIVEPVISPQTGNPQDITFQRAELVTIDVEIDIQRVGTLPSGVDVEIKQAIIDYAERKLLPTDIGFNVEGFEIGEDVPPGRLYTPVNKVIGAYGDSYITRIEVSRSPAAVVATPAALVYNELAVFDASNITVVINV